MSTCDCCGKLKPTVEEDALDGEDSVAETPVSGVKQHPLPFGFQQKGLSCCCDSGRSWFSRQGSEYLLGSVASVYGSRLPHRAVLSSDEEDECGDLCMATFSTSHMKSILKMVNRK